MLEVHEDYLARALDSIDERYPSVDAYLEQALGVGPAEREELRRRYLD
jgi:protein-tyrosine phosphatase